MNITFVCRDTHTFNIPINDFSNMDDFFLKNMIDDLNIDSNKEIMGAPTPTMKKYLRRSSQTPCLNSPQNQIGQTLLQVWLKTLGRASPTSSLAAAHSTGMSDPPQHLAPGADGHALQFNTACQRSRFHTPTDIGSQCQEASPFNN